MGGGSSTAARRARRVRRGRQEDEDGDHPDHETGRGQALSIGGGELLRLDAGMGRAAVRVVDMSLQRQVRQFGDPEKSAMGFIAHGVGVCTVVLRYAADNVVECWDYLTGLCVWRARVHGDEASIMCRARSGAVVVGTLTGHVCWVAVDGTLCASCLPPPLLHFCCCLDGTGGRSRWRAGAERCASSTATEGSSRCFPIPPAR